MKTYFQTLKFALITTVPSILLFLVIYYDTLRVHPFLYGGVALAMIFSVAWLYLNYITDPQFTIQQFNNWVMVVVIVCDFGTVTNANAVAKTDAKMGNDKAVAATTLTKAQDVLTNAINTYNASLADVPKQLKGLNKSCTNAWTNEDKVLLVASINDTIANDLNLRPKFSLTNLPSDEYKVFTIKSQASCVTTAVANINTTLSKQYITIKNNAVQLNNSQKALEVSNNQEAGFEKITTSLPQTIQQTWFITVIAVALSRMLKKTVSTQTEDLRYAYTQRHTIESTVRDYIFKGTRLFHCPTIHSQVFLVTNPNDAEYAVVTEYLRRGKMGDAKQTYLLSDSGIRAEFEKDMNTQLAPTDQLWSINYHKLQAIFNIGVGAPMA